MKENEAVYNLFKLVNEESANKYARSLKKYNIYTVGQLYGALNPILPKINKEQIKNKGLTASYLTKIELVNKKEYQTGALKTIIKAPPSELLKINDLLSKVDIPISSLKNNKSVLSLGCKSSKHSYRTTFWSNSPKAHKTKEGLFIVPNYSNAGTVFSQGERGTCVANATVSLIDYLTKNNYSRQFLYHQCKMIDGIPNTEGTYLETVAKVLSLEKLKDYGCVEENLWLYNPYSQDSEHQGPPPEACFDDDRFLANRIAYVRKTSLINDIITLLSGSDEADPVPVVISVALYSSFNNYSSQRTGWISMPLPSEKTIGGHAMLIVGFDKEEQLFLVRNSWGLDWAAENKWGYSGHAVIPYAYLKKYLYTGFSVVDHKIEETNVLPKDRLYNNKYRLESGQLAASKRKVKTNKKTNSPKKKKKEGFFKRLFKM